MSKSHEYKGMTSVPPEAGYPMDTQLNEVYLLSKFDVSSFSMAGEVVILLTLSRSKLIVILLSLGRWKLTLLVYFYWLWAGHSYFTKFEQDIRMLKTIQTLFLSSHFQWFNQQESRNGWIPQIINTIQKVQSFISFCNTFFWFKQ